MAFPGIQLANYTSLHTKNRKFVIHRSSYAVIMHTISAAHVTFDGSGGLVKERGWVLQGGGEGTVIWLDKGEPGSFHSTHTPHVEFTGLSNLLKNEELWSMVEQGRGVVQKHWGFTEWSLQF